MSTTPITDRQANLLARLVAGAPDTAADLGIDAANLGTLTRRAASTAIDALIAAQPAPDHYRWTRVGDAWFVTGPYAEPGDLITIRKANGETVAARIIDLDPTSTPNRPLWTVERIVDTGDVYTTADPALIPEAGHTYATADGAPVRVTAARGSGNLYATIWNGDEWEYAGRAGLARIARTLTADEAAEFGHRFGSCVFCRRRLTDDREGRSVDVGYGPVCAERHGLPWG